MQSSNQTLFSQINRRDSLIDISAKTDCVRVISLQGMSLLYANAKTFAQTVLALELLRGFRAAGRRVVLCDTLSLTAGSQSEDRELGHALVEEAGAEVLITCGTTGRDVAVGARDAGLNLASVVVCREATGACGVLADLLAPGDTILLLGIQQSVCDQLVETLNKRSSPKVAAAA